MQAFEIRYSQSGDRVALGWPGGLLAVHAVDPTDGSPGEELAQIVHHKATLVCVGWVGDGELVSVSEDGAWAVSDAATGAVTRSGSVGGEYVSADLSPSGASLFVYAYAGDEHGWRIGTADGTVSDAVELGEHVNVTSKVFAVDDDTALYRFFQDDDGVVEGLLRVDFAKRELSPKTFAHGPRSDFDEESYLLAVDPVRGIGIRPDYEPMELTGDETSGHAMVRAELFDLATLERTERIDVFGWPRTHLEGPYEGLATHAPGSEEFAEAQDWMIKKLTSAAFVRDTPHVWVGLAMGAVRRLALDGSQRDMLVFHGGGPDTGPPSLDDIFARNLTNLRTLGVSADGAYVGFGNPNDFFSVEAVDLENASEPIRLPPRHSGGETTESPGLVTFAGGRLVVFDRGDRMHFADGATGDVGRHVDLGEYYGEGRAVALSSDERFLVIAVAGGNSLLWDHESLELEELPVPPHAIEAWFVDERRAALVHHNGAVVLLDLETHQVDAVRAPEDEGDPPDEDWDAFEQRWDVRGAAFYTVAGVPHVATVDENDDLQTYAIGDGIEVGEGTEASSGWMAGGDDWVAISGGSSVRLLTMPGGGTAHTHEMGRVTTLETGDSGALYAFDDASGELSRIEGAEREVVFAYRGASAAQVHVSERNDRVVVVSAAGTIELHSLSSGKQVCELSIRNGEHGRVLVRE